MLVDPVNIFGASYDGCNARSIMGRSVFQPKSMLSVRMCIRARTPERVIGFRLSLSLPCKIAGNMVQ